MQIIKILFSKILYLIPWLLAFIPGLLLGANYSDQHYALNTDGINFLIESSSGIILNQDSSCFQLADDQINGYLILSPMQSDEPFDRGLPSWNGVAPDNNGGFIVKMRFPYNTGWSPWLTVGFWKAYIWNSYGATSYAGGEIDYDYVKLNAYQNQWQFMIQMERSRIDQPSPTLHKLSFFVSDSRTTENLDLSAIVNDNPDQILIPTDFFYQYALDDEIGPSICSPTSVSMVLRSYDIEVDPVQFARDTRDPYYRLFGIWPRVVQNASEFGLDGAVTRYRNWSEAAEVLARGGRVVMSVGPPLYAGHLMMLAGFTSNGTPLVHDPAKSNGYAYEYNKISLSQSWFTKGGVAYTFFPADNQMTPIVAEETHPAQQPARYELYQNYPNPFNPSTTIRFQIQSGTNTRLEILDLGGNLVKRLIDSELSAGEYKVFWNGKDNNNRNVASGLYIYHLITPVFTTSRRMILLR